MRASDLEHLAQQARDGFDRFEHGQPVGKREVPQSAQVESQHGQDDHLGRKGLGAGDAHFGPGVQVDSAIGLAGNRRAHGVHDRQRGMAPPAGLAEGAQRVGGLARLAEHEDERAVVERGVAIAKLAGVLDFDGQMRQPFDQVLAGHRRVPARAAGREDHPAHPAELPRRQVEPAEPSGRLGASQPAAAGVDDRLGLLADLLEHVVSVAAQLDRVGLPVDPVDPGRDRPALAMADLEVAGREPDHLAILQVSHAEPYAARSPRHRWPAGVRHRPRPPPAGFPAGRR